MTHRLILAIWLTAVWMALWGDFRAGNVVAGAVVAAVVVTVFKPDTTPWIVVRPIAALNFIAHFTFNLVRASLRVSRIVLDPHPGPVGGIIAVDVGTTNPGLVTIVANSISLTPGTLVVDTRAGDRRTTLYVHLLDTAQHLQERREIERLERLVTRAFGSTRAANDRHDQADRS